MPCCIRRHRKTNHRVLYCTAISTNDASVQKKSPGAVLHRASMCICEMMLVPGGTAKQMSWRCIAPLYLQMVNERNMECASMCICAMILAHEGTAKQISWHCIAPLYLQTMNERNMECASMCICAMILAPEGTANQLSWRWPHRNTKTLCKLETCLCMRAWYVRVMHCS